MGVSIIRGAEVTRPTPAPLTSSILDHATVVQKSDFGLRNNEGLWPSYNCLDTIVPTPICPDPLLDFQTYKNFSLAEWVPAFEFAVYGGVQCGTVGLDVADQKAEVERVFRANEGKGVEQALLAHVLDNTDSDAPVVAPAVNSLTTSAVSVAAALALLEGYAAAVYSGVPTIHMPRAAASFLGDAILWVGGKAFTRNGSKIAIGGGYDDPDNPTLTWNLYATGEVYVEQSDEVSVQSFVLPGDGSGVGSDENGLSHNTTIALVERMYRVGVDCFAAVAQGKAE